MLSTRIIEPNDPNYPSDAIHIWAENVLVNQHNQNKLNALPGNKYDIIAIDKVPENITNAMLEKVYQRSQMDTGGLARSFVIKLGAKVMLTSNIDVEDKLCNGQIGTVEHFRFDRDGNINTIYIKMEEEGVGTKLANSDVFGRRSKRK